MAWATTGVLDGLWVSLISSWVAAARYERETKTLWIRTKQGREYPWVQNCDVEKARNFFRVLSHGKWIWRHAAPRGLTGRGRSRSRSPARRK